MNDLVRYRDGKYITIEIWDFWKASGELPMILQMVQLLDMRIQVVYHAENAQSEFAKIAALENALRQTEKPFEMTILFKNQEENVSRRLLHDGYTCY